MRPDYIYRGVWRNYHLPFHRGWLLTLTDNESIALFAFLAVLIAWGQSRSWRLVRAATYRLVHSTVQLPVPDDQDLERKISQSSAVRWLLSKKHRQSHAHNIQRVSPAFGALAIANLCAFAALGILVPWILSNGEETPMVRSRKSSSCGPSKLFRRAASIRAADAADIFYRQCWNPSLDPSELCEPGTTASVSTARPPLHVSRDVVCPFDDGTCLNETLAVRLQYSNLTSKDLGINSKGNIAFSHRLTCAPIDYCRFLHLLDPQSIGNSSTKALLVFGKDLFSEPSHELTAITLLTCNGPSACCNEESGMKAVRAHGPYSFNVVPSTDIDWEEWDNSILPRLRVAQGTVFILGYKAGRSYYFGRVTDPMFSASRPMSDYGYNHNEYYFPDHELTTLGCVEQFQWCVGEGLTACTDWSPLMSRHILFPELFTRLSELWMQEMPGSKLIEQAPGSFEFVSLFFRFANVHWYLNTRRGTKVLLSSMGRSTELIDLIDKEEQWIFELKTWMETSFMMGRMLFLDMFQGAKVFENGTDTVDAAFQQLCSRVLLRDGNYTNILFLWFCLLCAFLSCIFLLSSEVVQDVSMKLLHQLAKVCKRGYHLVVWFLTGGGEERGTLRYITAEARDQVRRFNAFCHRGLRFVCRRRRRQEPVKTQYNGEFEDIDLGALTPFDLGDTS